MGISIQQHLWRKGGVYYSSEERLAWERTSGCMTAGSQVGNRLNEIQKICRILHLISLNFLSMSWFSLLLCAVWVFVLFRCKPLEPCDYSTIRYSKHWIATVQLFPPAEPTFISASRVTRNEDPDNEKIYVFFREKNSDHNPEADPWISRVARVCKVLTFIKPLQLKTSTIFSSLRKQYSYYSCSCSTSTSS